MRIVAAISAFMLGTLSLGAPDAMAMPGELSTMPTGRYVCELPGDGLGPASLHVPDSDFTLLRASRYRSAEGTGSYLLVGETFIMTGGPRQGERYIRKTKGFLRMLDKNGNESLLRCVLQTHNNR